MMKTKMKFAVCALVCMTMACAAASAEGNQPGGMGGNRPQMQQGQMKDDKKGGMPQGQAPDMNGQSNGQNQTPNMNGQNNGQNQAPDMNGQSNGQNQAPNMNGQGNAQNGQQKPDDQNAPKDMPTRLDAKKLLEDGVIDEDTYNAIEAYLKENAPEKPEGGEQDGQQPPEKPDGEADDDSADQPELPEIGGGLDEVQLKNLLDAGVITQEQYDAIVALLGSGENAV